MFYSPGFHVFDVLERHDEDSNHLQHQNEQKRKKLQNSAELHARYEILLKKKRELMEEIDRCKTEHVSDS